MTCMVTGSRRRQGVAFMCPRVGTDVGYIPARDKIAEISADGRRPDRHSMLAEAAVRLDQIAYSLMPNAE